MVIHAVTGKAVEFMLFLRQELDPSQLQQFFQAADVRALRLKPFDVIGGKLSHLHFGFRWHGSLASAIKVKPESVGKRTLSHNRPLAVLALPPEEPTDNRPRIPASGDISDR
jgi:hypothetical protein